MDEKPQLPILKRPRGRPRRDRPVTEHLLPALEVDFSIDPALQMLPCSEREQAKHLNWYVPEVRSVNQTLGLYKSLPMICQASGCHWAGQCPSAPDFMFEGRPCPLEMIQSFRLFRGYVREMEVRPDDSVDLDLIGELVRIQIQMQRIDQQLQVHGMLVNTIGGVNQKEGKALYEKTQHPLFTRQSQLREDRNRIHKSLIANRAEKEKLKQVEGRQKMDMLDFMRRMREASEEGLGPAKVEGDVKALPRSPSFDFIPNQIIEGSAVELPDDLEDENYDEE